MTFQDIFKSSFLENTTSVGIFDMGLALILAFGIGMFIFLVYKKTYQGVMYSSSFGTTLIALTMITTLVILAVISNVVLSLGMVGALSIVRFRTAVKEPLDLIFMFWSISIGIICGAGMVGLAFVLSLMATILVLVFYRLPEIRKSMILVINAESNACADKIYDTVRAHDKNYNVKSRNLTKESADFLMEIKSKNCESLLNDLNSIEGVISVSMVTHKGDAAC